MFHPKQFAAGLVTLLGIATCMLASPAWAIPPADPCVTIDPVTVNAVYNPFIAGGLQNTNLTITIRRWTGTGGQKTQDSGVIFLTQPGTTTGFQIVYNGSNILYAPTPVGVPVDSQAPGQIFVQFNGVGLPDVQTVTIPVTVSIPSGVDLSAGISPLFLDMRYACRTTGKDNGNFTATVPNSLRFDVTTVNGLQAFYAGPALDFGEIGTVTNAQAPTHTVTGNINVRSTGPYSVAMTSDNNFNMTPNATGSANPLQRIAYQVTFHGHTVSGATPMPLATCSRATLTARNLPVTVGLLEGGQGKAPSPSYRDNIHVTVTPLDVAAGGQTACP
jgi:hypothetical protein